MVIMGMGKDCSVDLLQGDAKRFGVVLEPVGGSRIQEILLTLEFDMDAKPVFPRQIPFSLIFNEYCQFHSIPPHEPPTDNKKSARIYCYLMIPL